ILQHVIEIAQNEQSIDIPVSVLIQAITHAHLNCAEYLLDTIYTPTTNIDGLSGTLLKLGKTGHLDLVKYLYTHPLLSTIKQRFTNTLSSAKEYGYLDIVHYLNDELYTKRYQ
ncbi:hypothetical protein CYY_009244, partial [Polysphondylium violaceum]